MVTRWYGSGRERFGEFKIDDQSYRALALRPSTSAGCSLPSVSPCPDQAKKSRGMKDECIWNQKDMRQGGTCSQARRFTNNVEVNDYIDGSCEGIREESRARWSMGRGYATMRESVGKEREREMTVGSEGVGGQSNRVGRLCCSPM
jgi:hypothetical protein